MEIHAPHEPILTLKEFMVHLLVVTAGILIALGLEQSVEAWHHHSLAEEARTNMRAEIADNKKELDANIGKMDAARKEREKDIQMIDQLLAHKKLEEMSVSLNFSNATLNSASWSTASTIGALSFMDYGEVKKFAEVYKLQDLYEHVQNDEIKSVQTGFGILSSLQDGPEKVPTADLLAMKSELRQRLVALQIMGQLGKALSDEYAKVLHK